MSPAAIDKVLGIVFGAVLTAAVSAFLGHLILVRLRSLGARLTRTEGWIFAFGIGAACLSQVMFLLCLVGGVFDAVLWSLAILLTATWWRQGRSMQWLPASPPEPDDRFWWGVLAIVAAFYGYLYLPHALAPEIHADGVGYHLGLVGRYYREHGFPHITSNIYAHLSQGAEMLFLFAYGFGRHSAAKLVHFSFLIATVAAMLAFARRFRVWRAGVAGAVLFACASVVGTDATSAYNDCALAFYVFLTYYGLVLWGQQRQRDWLIVLGILSGFCFSIKYTGFLAVPFVAVWVGWGTWRRLQDRGVAARRMLGVVGVACLFVAPWLAKNAWFVGNPVAPLFNRLFPNPYVVPIWEDGYREWLRHYDHSPPPRWQEVLQAPLELTLRGEKLQGLFGPVFLLAPLALLAWRHPLAKGLWATALIFALPWCSNAGARFLIPSCVFVSLAMGLALYRLPRRLAAGVGCAVLLLHTLSSWPWLLPKWNAYGVWRLWHVPWKAALRIQSEHEYLGDKLPFFGIAQILVVEADRHSRVLSLEPIPEAYFDAELLVTYQGAENEELMRILLAGAEPDLWPLRSRQLTWPAQPLRGFRILQRAQHDTSMWMVSEIRLLSAETEIIPATTWRIRARPFPWTAARAFDGNPFTAWRSWEYLYDGMSMEVRFPEPLQLGRAEIIYPRGQHFVRFDYEGQLPGGAWRKLDVKQEVAWRPVSAAEVRAWIPREFRRRGIGFLVTNTAGSYQELVQMIAANPGAWGLEEVGRDGPARLYRVR